MNQGLYLLCCYLLGAIPTGYIAGRLLKGIDIRNEGSGNMGATNVLRVLGKGPGIAVLLIDLAKGGAAIWWLPLLFNPGVDFHVLGALAAVLGHNYTCFLNFKGGKGVATSAGALIALAPHAMLIVVTTFIVVAALTRMVSAGSILAATALPLALWYAGESGPGERTLWLGVLLCIFIWVRHIPNIRRIMAGTENRLGKKS